ncbi:MAG: DUF488 domain-containing protein [Pseudomonadota bacterium]
MNQATEQPARVWTIGHSTHSLEAFVALLRAYAIEGIVDVRRFPGSRRYPQFGSQILRDALKAEGIAYLWLEPLGGRRRAQADSPNLGWRNAAFRGYADHLASGEFARGLEQLLAFAGRQPSALMCAELLWWRCHRVLIADVLKQRGMEVIHIQDAAHSTLHPYSVAARLVDGRLCYPAESIPEDRQGDLFG